MVQSLSFYPIHIGFQMTDTPNRFPTANPDFTVIDAVITQCSAEGFVVGWQTQSAGFGELCFYSNPDGWVIESETMGPEFCKAVLAKLIDSMEIRR